MSCESLTAPMLVMINDMLVDARPFSGYQANARRDPLAPPKFAPPAALPSPVSQSGARADVYDQRNTMAADRLSSTQLLVRTAPTGRQIYGKLVNFIQIMRHGRCICYCCCCAVHWRGSQCCWDGGQHLQQVSAIRMLTRARVLAALGCLYGYA